MSVSFLASVRAMFGPSPAFDRPQRAGTPPRPDAHAPGAADAWRADGLVFEITGPSEPFARALHQLGADQHLPVSLGE